MFLEIRTIVTNTTGQGGKRARPVRLPLNMARGASLPGPGAKLTIPGHLETLVVHTARKGRSGTQLSAMKSYLDDGAIDVVHEAKVGDAWLKLEDVLEAVATTPPPPTPTPEPVPEPEPTPEPVPEPEPTPAPKTRPVLDITASPVEAAVNLDDEDEDQPVIDEEAL